MVPNPAHTCLGLEYFCFENDDLWSMEDPDLIKLLPTRSNGWVLNGRVIDAAVVRMPKAYPIYDGPHAVSLERLRGYLRPLRNLQLVGRNGMHKYNNQDHSMFTAMLAVKTLWAPASICGPSIPTGPITRKQLRPISGFWNRLPSWRAPSRWCRLPSRNPVGNPSSHTQTKAALE